jgi:succinate dehydrogenase hydrophobic anchor subunit
MDNKSINIQDNILWLAQAIMGILLVILLSIHLIINHWAAPQGLLTYVDIIRYYDFPGVAIMEAAFLIVVTSHCLLGLHSILLDLNFQPFVTRVLAQILIILGIITVVYGIYLITKIV